MDFRIIGRIVKGALVGGLAGVLAGPLVGFIWGLLVVGVVTWLNPASPAAAADYSLLELVLVIAYPLLAWGMVMGGLTGCITAAIRKSRAGALVAVLVGIGSGVIFAQAPRPTPGLFFSYAIPSVITCLIAANLVEVCYPSK